MNWLTLTINESEDKTQKFFVKSSEIQAIQIKDQGSAILVGNVWYFVNEILDPDKAK